ncbi:MAG: xylulokinase [Limnochordia bacterium]
MAYLIGVDVGTSGTKSLLIDAEGRVYASRSAGYRLHQPQLGWAEQSAEDWWQATCSTIRQLLEETGTSPHDVVAVGFSGQMHGSVFLDKEGHVIRPPLLWCDVRTAAECREITSVVGERQLIESTSNPALEGFTAPKLLWLRNHEPVNYAKLAHVLLPKDYVCYRLTGELATEVSDAAGTLLFDVAHRSWSQEVLRALDIDPAILPRVMESVEVRGLVSEAGAQATGLAVGTKVVGGGADNACGAVGAGIVREGRFLSSIGSSGVILAHTETPRLDPSARVHTFNHAVPGRWYLMGVMLAAGLSLRWFRDEMGPMEKRIEQEIGLDAYDLLGLQAAKSPPGSRGLVFLPYLNGERTPHADADARGVLFGLSSAHTRGDVIRAIMEGVTFGLRDSVEIMRDMGLSFDRLRVLGGGARSPLWVQMQADVFQTTVERLQVDEGPAYGAALLAGVGADLFASVAEAAESTVRVGDVLEPNPANKGRYDDMFGLYRALYPALREGYAAAARLSRRPSPAHKGWRNT